MVRIGEGWCEMPTRPLSTRSAKAAVELGNSLATFRKLQGLTAAQVSDRAGITRNMVRANVSPADVPFVFLTHLHHDHICDFPLFAITSWMWNRQGSPIVVGPKARLVEDRPLPQRVRQ